MPFQYFNLVLFTNLRWIFFIFHFATQLLRVPLEIVFVWLFFTAKDVLHIFPQLWFNLCIFAKVIDQVGNVFRKMATKIN